MGFFGNIGYAAAANAAADMLRKRKSRPWLWTPLPASLLAAEATRGEASADYQTFNYRDAAWSSDFWILDSGEIIFPLLALAALALATLRFGMRGLAEAGFPLAVVGALSVSIQGWLVALAVVLAYKKFARKKNAVLIGGDDNEGKANEDEKSGGISGDAIESGVAGLVTLIGAIIVWWALRESEHGFWPLALLAVIAAALCGIAERYLSRYLHAAKASPQKEEKADAPPPKQSGEKNR